MSKSADIEESELLRRLKQGSMVAFDTIYFKYGEALALRLHRLIKLPNVVEELHQDVFIRLWNHREKIDANTHIRSYLFTIARNLAIDFYRKAAKDKALQSQLIQQVDISYNHIDALLNVKEMEAIIERAIAKLPPKRQQVFRKIKLEGTSYREASHYFGVSVSTIKDHMEKAAEFLKNELKENYPHILFGMATYLMFV